METVNFVEKFIIYIEDLPFPGNFDPRRAGYG